MNKLYVGFDPGLSTPTAVVVDDVGVLRKLVKLPSTKLPKEPTVLQQTERVATIVQALLELVHAQQPRAWAIEGYAYGERFTAHQLGELGGVLRYRAMGYFKKGLMPFPHVVPPTSLKKFCLGRGGGKGTDKIAVAVAVNRLWGWELPDEHAYDAAVLAQVARALDGAYPSPLAYQVAAISGIRRG